ncbi:GGDEF domain-containing protein [Paramagnetospirillum kuznetsovii]|uniref:GGDEF domain-containing protein n=1 Tax=Paramagnetospirillum kuznetsovii TaxID=2053833 RepID=A0A364P377_9PROT|nr:EAL domain-containing protein [Paramagnetospirillum kuznetsovii]RAU23730.1 GGDEF domain-containing protein [Paramagnetospirillum kuznetsovii]
MVFRSIERRIVAVFVGLLALVTSLTLLLVIESNDRVVSGESERRLGAGVRTFDYLVAYSQSQMETAASVLARDFSFREAIATQDRATVLSVLRNHGSRIGAGFMMVVSLDGMVMADTLAPGGKPRPAPFDGLLRAAQATGQSAGFDEMDGRLYQIAIVPIMAPGQIAWVAMGFNVDDSWARSFSAMSGLGIAVLAESDGRTVVPAGSLSAELRDALGERSALPPPDIPILMSLNGQRHHVMARPMSERATAVLLLSLDQAEAVFRDLHRSLAVIALGGAVLFILGSLRLARHIARPVNTLAEAARRIEAGDYHEPVPDSGADEIGQLAASFDRMRQGIAAREQKILRLAYEDGLTGLPNRTWLLDRLGRTGPTPPCAVLILDLDRFGLINDALGHAVGDRLLRLVGDRLVATVAPGIGVCRLWGDEFAVVRDGTDTEAAIALSVTIHAALQEPILLDGQRIDVGGSLGIGFWPQDAADSNTLLQRTELAVREAKRQFRGYALASEIGAGPPHEQLSLIGEMRDALLRQEFEVFYQPKLDLASGRVTGAEALLRWRHPSRGLIPPAQFIPFAEQTGFIREITPWLLDQVVARTAAWRAQGLNLVVSANLSTLDLLHSGLAPLVKRLLASSGLPPGQLCLEITESALMDDPDLALATLNQLAESGVRLSIDDYGAGHASLAYLKSLPVHELKIDQAFIFSLMESGKDAEIVRSTIALGHALGLKVVAEGAETDAELGWLKRAGCDVAQGYGIARPMPGAEVTGWMADQDSAVAR